MDFLSLLSGSGLAGTDSPDGLVGDDDVLELLNGQVEYATLELSLANLVLLVGLTLFEALSDAEDHLQSVLECKKHLLLQDFGSLTIVAATLRVTENHILCSGALHHFGRNLTRVGTFLLVGAVLGSESDDILIEELGDRSQMDKRSADDYTTVRLLGG